MATLDNVWAMYMGLKDRRRQAERDQVADDKYADQLQQQALGNIRADEQLRLNQDAAERAKEAVTLEQTRWDGLAGQRANEKTLQEQNITQGKQTIAAGALKDKTDRLKITGEQAKNLVFRASREGAQQTLNDPTQMPIVENLIAEVLEVNNFLPDGTTFAGFEEIAGPGRDGKSTKVFVPMMEDANGQKTDIGQMLGGEGADAFTAEQIVAFIERAGQADYGANTSMVIDSATNQATAAQEADSLNAQQLGQTTTALSGQQQQQTQTDPTLTQGLGENLSADINDPAVDPAVRFGSNRPGPLYTGPKTGGRAYNRDPDAQEIAANRLVYNIFKNPSLVANNYPKSMMGVTQALVDELDMTPEEAQAYVSEMYGSNQGQGVDGFIDQLAEDPLTTGEAIGEVADTASTAVGGLAGDIWSGLKRYGGQAVNSTVALGQDISAGYNGVASKADWDNTDPGSSDQQAQTQAYLDQQKLIKINDERQKLRDQKTEEATLEGKTDKSKRQLASEAEVEATSQLASTEITTEQVAAAQERVVGSTVKGGSTVSAGTLASRAVDMLILKEAGFTITNKDMVRYQLTGRANPVEVPSIKTSTVTFDGVVHQVSVDPDNPSKSIYTPLGDSAATTSASRAATAADEAAVETHNEGAMGGAITKGLGAAGIVVDGKEVGQFMPRDEFDKYMNHMMTVNKTQIDQIYKLNLVKGQPISAGQTHLLSILAQHLAQEVAKSGPGTDGVWGMGGTTGSNHVGDFGRLVKAAAPDTGIYVTGGGVNGYESVDDMVKLLMKQFPYITKAEATADAHKHLKKKQDLNQ